MTEPLYHTDAYLKEFDAVVTAVEATPSRLTAPRFIRAAVASPTTRARSRMARRRGR